MNLCNNSIWHDILKHLQNANDKIYSFDETSVKHIVCHKFFTTSFKEVIRLFLHIHIILCAKYNTHNTALLSYQKSLQMDKLSKSENVRT